MTAPAPGRFVWHEVHSPDPEASVAYYTGLFGWEHKTVDMGEHGSFHAFVRDGASFAGAVSLAEGDPPHWASYVDVPDLQAALDRTEFLGGTVQNRGTDVPQVGRYGRIADGEGAMLYPFQWAGEPSPEPEGEVTGGFVWHELLCRDPEAARKFYGGLFGWETKLFDMPTGTYTLLLRPDGRDFGGMMPMPPDAQGPSNWLPYVAVDDVDASAAKVTSLGGQVFVPPTDIPDVGRFSVTADPQGAMVALYKHARGGK